MSPSKNWDRPHSFHVEEHWFHPKERQQVDRAKQEHEFTAKKNEQILW